MSGMSDSSYEKYQVQCMPLIDKDGVVVENFHVTKNESDFHKLRCAMNRSTRGVESGTYTRLIVDNVLWMSDTPAEISDCYPLFNEVRYQRRVNRTLPIRILLHGLGLGVTIKGCMVEANERCHITVVEKDPRIIEHVGSYWKSVYPGKLHIIQGDALTWKPEKNAHWDIVWHDIWPSICGDNYKSMTKLHRRFGCRCTWQDSWCRDEVMAHRSR